MYWFDDAGYRHALPIGHQVFCYKWHMRWVQGVQQSSHHWTWRTAFAPEMASLAAVSSSNGSATPSRSACSIRAPVILDFTCFPSWWSTSHSVGWSWQSHDCRVDASRYVGTLEALWLLPLSLSCWAFMNVPQSSSNLAMLLPIADEYPGSSMLPLPGRFPAPS